MVMHVMMSFHEQTLLHHNAEQSYFELTLNCDCGVYILPFARVHHSNNHIFTFQLNSSKEEVKAVQEKMDKQKEENEKKLEDEKKLTETNSKSHQTELQSKLDVSQKPLNGKKNCNVENQGLLI